MDDHQSLSTLTDLSLTSTVSPLFVIPDVCVSTILQSLLVVNVMITGVIKFCTVLTHALDAQ